MALPAAQTSLFLSPPQGTHVIEIPSAVPRKFAGPLSLFWAEQADVQRSCLNSQDGSLLTELTQVDHLSSARIVSLRPLLLS